jgi:hypothetical protein
MRLQSFAAALVALAAVSAPAQAASLLEKNFWLSGPNYDGVLPLCQDPSVTGTIASRFASNETEYWNSTLAIKGFDNQREIAFRPWGESFIPRRFCAARALTSDGRYRTVDYSIIEDYGSIGVSWGVEWCVNGLDRPLAYAPNCKMARP